MNEGGEGGHLPKKRLTRTAARLEQFSVQSSYFLCHCVGQDGYRQLVIIWATYCTVSQ